MYKQILALLFLSLPFASNAQMFDKKHKSVQQKEVAEISIDTYEKEINIACDAGFDQFRKNLVKMADWELKQYVRILREIKAETKGYSPQIRQQIKDQKVIELAMLLSDKEMDMDFQHYELIAYLNEINEKWGVDALFQPEVKVEGRLQNKMIEIALYQIEEKEFQDAIKKYVLNGTDIADLAIGLQTGGAGGAAATALGLTGSSALGISIIVGTGAYMLLSTSVEKCLELILPNLEEILNMREVDFIDGLMEDEYQDFKEQIRLNTIKLN